VYASPSTNPPVKGSRRASMRSNCLRTEVDGKDAQGRKDLLSRPGVKSVMQMQEVETPQKIPTFPLLEESVDFRDSGLPAITGLACKTFLCQR
jgi:hypothetical protein